MENLNITVFPVGADTIPSVQITNKSLGMVSLTWDEPKEPNGLTLTYQIEYKRKDIDNVSVYNHFHIFYKSFILVQAYYRVYHKDTLFESEYDVYFEAAKHWQL